ncbi:sugar transferase [Staphylococcus aureus]|uniref:sugar transferase n=1 Tax=Staphylococcus aureus TaxID=1280 RepID=UPI001C11F404|nr:sugar transferase [Staphylococcus aureus]
MKKLQLKKWKCRENDIEAVHNKGYAYQRKLDKLEEVRKSYYPIKRAIDLILSIVLLFLTLPIMVIFAIAIVIDSPGNPIYSQVRVGKMGKLIKIYKLRSMCKNAEKNGAQWADKDDDRITNVGKFIRKTRIDELPQLINVVKGEMSFIGPRPERPEFVELFSSEVIGFEQRYLVTPGLTGLAQIQGGYDLTPQQKLKYDMKYIHKGSLMMELYISIRTLMVVITGEGSR